MIALSSLRESVPSRENSKDKVPQWCRLCIFEDQQGGRCGCRWMRSRERRGRWGQRGDQGCRTQNVALKTLVFYPEMGSKWEFSTEAQQSLADLLRKNSAVKRVVGRKQSFMDDGGLNQGDSCGGDGKAVRLLTVPSWGHGICQWVGLRDGRAKDESRMTVAFGLNNLEEPSCHLLRWARQQEKQILCKIREFILDLVSEWCLLHSQEELLSRKLDIHAWFQGTSPGWW